MSAAQPPHLDALLNKLGRVTKTGPGQFSAHCLAHADSQPSLSVGLGDQNRILLHCHAGCETADIVEAMGLKMQDLFADSNRVSGSPNAGPANTSGSRATERVASRPVFACADDAMADWARQFSGELAAWWSYTDGDGNEVARTIRFETRNGKTFRPIRRVTDGWEQKAPDDPRPLYRVDKVLSLVVGGILCITEGEKAADTLFKCGYVATTSWGGAKSAAKADWTALAKIRPSKVLIFPDCDEPGEAYATDVAAAIHRVNPELHVAAVRLPGLKKGEDIVDWIAARGGAA